jgi:hypothetical protein
MKRFLYLALLVLLAPVAAMAAGGTCPASSVSYDSRTPSATPGPLSAIGVTSCFFVASNGSDSNDGLSEASGHPWLHAPGMPNCSGVCASTTITAGEGIIVRGNDVWHVGNSALTPYTGGIWNFNTTGNSTNLIYIGVDPTWFSGASFGRPVLNGDNPVTAGGIVASCAFPAGTNFWFFGFLGSEYTVLDNFEFTGLCWNDTPNNSNQHAYLKHFGGNSQKTSFHVFSNLYFHGWTHTAFTPSTCGNSTPSGVCNNVQAMLGNTQLEQGTLITHTIIDGADSDPLSMNGIDADGYDVEYSVMRNLGGTQILDNCHIAHDNLFEHINNDQSNSTHSDMWFCIGEYPSNNFFYNNLVRFIGTDFSQPLSAIFWFNENTTGLTDYVYNNVGHDVNCAANCNNFENPAFATTTLIFNNTWESKNNVAVWANGNSSSWAITDANNHYITNNGSTCSAVYAKVTTVNGGVTSCAGDVFQTISVANAQGYVAGNDYAPTLSSNATVGTGVNETSQVANFGPAFAASTTNGCSYTTGTITCPAVTSHVRQTTGGVWDQGAYFFQTSGGSVTLSPTGNTYPSTVLTNTSAAATFTLSNTTASGITGISAANVSGNTGDFTNTGAGTCSTTLSASSSCTYTVTFGPTGIGARSTTFTVTDSAGTQTSALTGTGVSQTGTSATSISFGNVVDGTVSPQQFVTITNNGSTGLTGVAVTLGGANPSLYAKVTPSTGTDCNAISTLAASASCNAAVTFSPVTVGTFPATLSFASSATGSPLVITLTGNGINPIVSPTQGFATPPGFPW